MSFVGRRGLHTTAVCQFKQKVKEQSKMKTPRKSSGEYRSFRRAAAFSLHSKKAEKVQLPKLTKTAAPAFAAQPQVSRIPSTIQGALSHLADFQQSQNHELFAQKAFVSRKETALLAEALSNNTNLLLTGSAGAGKSTLLAQAHALAKLQGFVVLHIPRAQELTNGDHAISFSEQNVLQPMFARRWMRQIAKANKDVLTADDLKLLKITAKAEPAKALADFFELVKQGKVANGAPVVLSIDNINAWAQKPVSDFYTRENKAVYAGDLQIPKLFRDFISGRSKLPKGSVIAATSSHFHEQKTIDVAVGKLEAPAYRSLSEFDPSLAADLSNLKHIEVGSLSYDETAAFAEYLKKAGLLEEEASAHNLYAQTSGNPKAIIRSTVSFGLGSLGLGL